MPESFRGTDTLKARKTTPLFPSHQQPPADCLFAHIDGAARGNPGPAAYGVVFRNPDNKVLASFGRTIGEATNNVAEYHGLLAALEYAHERGFRAVKVFSDSELLVRQLRGEYKVKSPDLKPLYEHARAFVGKLVFFDITAVPRERNRDADRLANQALDRLRVCAPPERETRIEAVYERGVLKPARKLNLPEGTHVEVVVRKK